MKLPWRRETDKDREKTKRVDDVTRDLALAILDMDKTLKQVRVSAAEVVNGRNNRPTQDSS